MSKTSESIQPADALPLIAKGTLAALDVRSEGEFEQGSIPGFRNLPILTNEERHQVGLTFKEKGQEAAIGLGHRLVSGVVRDARVREWVGALSAEPENRRFITCWRGGLRSKIACEWIEETGLTVSRIEGGYKALRAELLSTFSTSPELIVISGMTGSGKTKLIQALAVPKIDLEAMANHRGSSFGKHIASPQPAQATFENRLGLALWRASDELIIEDESSNIGVVRVPAAVKEKMTRSPVVVVAATPEARADHIYKEYVEEPLHKGFEPSVVRDAMLRSLEGIRKRLGHQLADQIRSEILVAFAVSDPARLTDPERHRAWIVNLLLNYYDKLYQYAFDKQKARPVLFKGDLESCSQWIRDRFASRKL